MDFLTSLLKPKENPRREPEGGATKRKTKEQKMMMMVVVVMMMMMMIFKVRISPFFNNPRIRVIACEREQWGDYCDNFGDKKRDPNAHDTALSHWMTFISI